MEKKPDPIDIEVGRKLCALRITRGYNQSDLAQALGLTFQQVQKYEKGANRVSASKLWRVAQFLGVKVAHFFPDEADGEVISLPTARLGVAHNGQELAGLFMNSDKVGRDAILTVARAVQVRQAQAA